MLQIDLHALDLCLHFLHSLAMYCVSVTRHFINPYFFKIACKLGHFLSSEEWLSQTFLFWLCLLYLSHLIHLYAIGKRDRTFFELGTEQNYSMVDEKQDHI